MPSAPVWSCYFVVIQLNAVNTARFAEGTACAGHEASRFRCGEVSSEACQVTANERVCEFSLNRVAYVILNVSKLSQ